MSKISIFKELWDFMKVRKKFWLAPIIIRQKIGVTKEKTKALNKSANEKKYIPHTFNFTSYPLLYKQSISANSS